MHDRRTIKLIIECPQLDILIELLNLGIKKIVKKEKQIMATLDQIIEKVTAQTTRIASLNTLMDGIRQQLADILAGTNLPPAVQAKIDAVFAAVEKNSADIEEAITENTPPEPVEPPPDTV